MYHNTSDSPLSEEELQYRRLVLRDALICIGCIKLMSIFCYTGLYVLIKMYSEGAWAHALHYMLLIIIPIQILTAILLFLGAIQGNGLALDAALWLSLLTTIYTTIVSLIGAIYFIRHGTEIIHFVLAAIFGVLSFSVCFVFCHDIIVVYMFVKIVKYACAPEPGCAIISHSPDSQKVDITSA